MYVCTNLCVHGREQFTVGRKAPCQYLHDAKITMQKNQQKTAST